MKIKEELFKEGILTYDDAYKLAFRYIKDLNIDFKVYHQIDSCIYLLMKCKTVISNSTFY